MSEDPWAATDSDDIETVSAQGRLPERTYASRGFTIKRPTSRDFQRPARFIYKVFDNERENTAAFDGEQYTIEATDHGQRFQLKLLISRKAGAIKELWVHRVPASGDSSRVRQVLNLRREDARRLIETLRNIDAFPVASEVEAFRVDDALLRDILADPSSIAAVYREDPERFRQVIKNDEAARDVVAVAHRRQQVQRFRRLLDDDAYFDEQAARSGPESVWQQFLEENPWLLGVSLGGQLLTAWGDDRLEQVVVGASVSSPGKRSDALLKTAGRIRSLVFAEIKHHRTHLLKEEYRSGCWTPSPDLSGGVAQLQGTVQRAVVAIGARLPELSSDGSELPGQFSYLIRPKSYLIVGRLDELVGEEGGINHDKIQSFELYRRHLQEPEVITFDELLARAEWLVQLADAG